LRKLFQLLPLFLALAASCTAARASTTIETMQPLRPGVPGRTPFWNANAKQFIWPPAFDIPGVPGAGSYRFQLVNSAGQSLSFTAPEPWAALTPIWEAALPGTTTVTIEALLNTKGSAAKIAGQRVFHRGAPFKQQATTAALAYEQSARVALASVIHEPFVQGWLKNDQPDPDYALYRYASKVLASVLTAGSLYAQQQPPPADAAQALKIARAAADYLIRRSLPDGSPLAGCPPTYDHAKPTERENDGWSMMISPAEAGQAFLNLYDATHDQKYLDAARRCADAYQRTQLASGTWHLKIDNATGAALAPVELIPTGPVLFLDRLISSYMRPEYTGTRDRAIQWIMSNPVHTFNWQAQFDDAKVRGAYENLGKHEACEFAGYLFEKSTTDPLSIQLAEELLQFAEDQFVTWEQPPQLLKIRDPRMQPGFWIIPCSLEQYAMFEPISGSSAFMIMTYVRAFQATGKQLYLDRARSLANALTVAQQQHGGRYPTRMIPHDLAYWINSTVNCVRAMIMLASAEQD
jgi:maltose/maltodextrin transport system substrate-binding protein